ncbi:MAG: PorP/SprF family type IX secretion system membrane protein [Bacteroidetes bacterium]|mgnify:FL=1|nr:PorP/SprF family type IX secretion system membrane protein [Bacteroidota bacterium]
MKRISFLKTASILLFSLLLFNSTLQAQQDPLYTNYMFNKLVYNPAYTGTNPEFACVTFLYHNQWTGYSPTEGIYSGAAPGTETFSIHAPFKGSNWLGGWGFYAIRDQLGFQENLSANLSLSVKKYFSFGAIYLGLNSGFYQRSINNRDWISPDGHVFDPSIPSDEYSDIKADFGAGIYIFKHNRYYVGISSQHINNSQFDWGGEKNQFARQSYISGGYSFIFPAYPRLDIQPSFLYKIDYARQQLDLNLNVVYFNKLWVGAQYRQNDAVSMLIGVIPSKYMRIGFSYDLTTTNMNSVSNGTTEFFIQFCKGINIGPPLPHSDLIIWTPRFL